MQSQFLAPKHVYLEALLKNMYIRRLEVSPCVATRQQSLARNYGRIDTQNGSDQVMDLGYFTKGREESFD